MASTQQRVIRLDGKQAAASLTDLINKADQLRDELSGLTTGTDYYVKKLLELSKANAQVDKLTTAKQKLIEKYGTLEQIQKRQIELQQKLTSAQQLTESELKDTTNQLNELSKAYRKLAAIENGVQLNTVTKQIGTMRNQSQNLGATFLQLGAYAGIAFSVDRIVQFGTQVLKVASDFEQTSIAYETMLGSKEKADKLQAQIIDLVAKTPFELPEVQQATKSLLAFGFSAEEIIPNLTNLGNIASGVGREKLPQLILAFGQVKAATRLTGNELRQFTEAGVPLLDEIAKQLKKPVSEIKKMVEEGEIGFPIVQKALSNLSAEGGRFANLMQKQSQTLGGLWSTFKDNFTQGVMLPIGQTLSNILKPALESATSWLGKLNFETKNVTDSVIKSQAAFNIELETLKKGNITKDAKRELINKINKEYGQYLPALLTEKSSIDEITKAQIAGNKAFDKRITLMAAEEALVQSRKKMFDLKAKELDLAREVAITEESIYNTTEAQTEADQMRDAAQKSILNDRVSKQKENIELQKKETEGYEKLMKVVEKMGGTTSDKSTSTGTTTGLSDKQKKAQLDAEEHQKNALAKIREMFQKHAADLLEQQVQDDARDEARIREKYRKDLIELEKLEKDSDKKVREEAHTTRLKLIEQQDNEIAAKKKENADKTILELNKISEKFGVELNDGLISDLDRKIQAIKNKYADEFAKIGKAEQSDNPAIKEAAQKARVAATKAQKAEIEQETERHYQALYAKEDKYWQDKQLATASNEEREKLEIEFHYQKILDTERLSYEERIALTDEMSRRLGAVTTKHRKEREKDAQEEAKKVLEAKQQQFEAEKRLEIAKLSAAQQGAAILRDFVGENTAIGKALFAFEKAMAIAQVVKNLAIETSALRTAAAIQMMSVSAIPGAPAAVQAALLTKLATAKINAGINIASIAAQAVSGVVRQKYDGRYTTVTGERDGKSYTPQYIGYPSTGMLPNSPVLFASATGAPILASEKGREYLVNNESLKIPEVDWHVRAIDNIVKYGKTRQFYTGGDTSTATQKPIYISDNTATNTTSGSEYKELTAAINRLNTHLDNGIEATFDYGTVRDIKKAISKLNDIQGQ